MVAQVAHPSPTPTLRVVPAMDDAAAQPTPLASRRRVVNTLRCANDLCKLPLCEVTKDRTYRPLHAAPEIRLIAGTPELSVTCPACGTTRTVVVR